MILKNKSLCFLFSVTIHIIIASELYESDEKKMYNIVKIIDDINSQDKDQYLQEFNDGQPNHNLKMFLKNLRNANENRNSINMEDRMCKKRGKCTCESFGALCNRQDVYEVANDVSKIIDNINRQASNNEEILKSLRCSAGRCGDDENLDTLNDLVAINDSEKDNPYIKDEIYDGDPNQNLLEAVLSELQEIYGANNGNKNKLSKTTKIVIPLTPEDMANHFRAAMDDVRQALLGYVKYRTNFKTMRGLPRAVRIEIQNLRERYRHFKISDKALSKQIFDILLGDMKRIKIIPDKDSKNSYDIFLPVWMYMDTLNKKEGRRLRSNKRLLPLTLHQKNRMQNKQRPTKLLKYVWRRSFNPDQVKYGVPFVLDIHGLGQIN